MYDVTDEGVDRTYSALLHLLRNLPDHLGKSVLCSVLEETALFEALLREAGVPVPEGEARQEAAGRLWDEVLDGREARAAALVQNLMRQES